MDLKRRIEEFKEMEYEFNKDFYATIKEQQHPHTLFIACSDSRVDAETLFQAHAGEIFQIRNVANIVPREEEPDTHPSVVSAIEYAVIVLGVENLIVCGHSNCGGCAAIRNLEKYKEKLPYTAEWISQSITISDYIDYRYPDMKEEDKIIMLEKLNAVQQLDNLMTYEFVRKRVEAGDLNLQAYYYNIGTGTISVYDYDSVFSDMIKEITSNRKLMYELKTQADSFNHIE
jgi:carbonic anhydrase